MQYISPPQADGSSLECTKLCQMLPSCTGYQVPGRAPPFSQFCWLWQRARRERSP